MYHFVTSCNKVFNVTDSDLDIADIPVLNIHSTKCESVCVTPTVVIDRGDRKEFVPLRLNPCDMHFSGVRLVKHDKISSNKYTLALLDETDKSNIYFELFGYKSNYFYSTKDLYCADKTSIVNIEQ